MPLQIETRTNGAIAILRGPLNFTVKLSFNQTTTIYLQYNSMIKCRESNLKVSRSTQALGDVKRLFPNAPAQYLTTVCILILLVFLSSYISCRLTIILKTTPFFPLIPGSSQLIHRLSWFTIQLTSSLWPTGENYLFKYGNLTVSLSQWQQKHARSNGDWIWIWQHHHLWVLSYVSRIEL